MNTSRLMSVRGRCSFNARKSGRGSLWICKSVRCISTLPAHLRTPFPTSLKPATCMIVGNPLWRYALAEAPPSPEVLPLINAIKTLQDGARPFRIVSHVTEDGKVSVMPLAGISVGLEGPIACGVGVQCCLFRRCHADAELPLVVRFGST